MCSIGACPQSSQMSGLTTERGTSLATASRSTESPPVTYGDRALRIMVQAI
jgi:hypothetical protein